MKTVLIYMTWSNEVQRFDDPEGRLEWRTISRGEQDGWLVVYQDGQEIAMVPSGQWSWVRSDFAPIPIDPSPPRSGRPQPRRLPDVDGEQ